MPAGIAKTPNSGRAKDASAAKSADRNANNTGSGGKKFVQTRLPFKLITPVAKTAETSTTSSSTTPSTSAAASSVPVVDLDDVEREPRKRKLSYGCEKESDTEQLRRSNSKENLELGVTAITPNKKPKTVDTEDVVEVIDDDDEVEAESVLSDSVPKKTKQKPAEGANHHPAPVQIKLPLNNKRSKRRKSLKKAESVEKAPLVKEPLTVDRSDSSDDIEAIAEELNPQKRPKVVEAKPNAKLELDAKAKPKTPVQAKKEKEKESKSSVKSKKIVKELKTVKAKEVLDSQMDVDSDEALVESDCDAKPGVAAAPEQSSSDVEMDVDADTLNKTSTEKEEQDNEEEEENKASTSSDKTQNLTAKQQKLMEQRRKAREEKERKLQEERRLKQQEKEQREQQKKAEREQKEEQRRKEREDKEQVKRQEREEKERKRQAEVDKKDEEKRKRNEAKEEVQRKKDEERRRKEQEKEEAELKKKRAAASFTKFFVPKQPKQSMGGSVDQDQNSSDSGPSNGNSQTLAFRPFQIKDHVIMAPVIRATIPSDTRYQLDRLFREDDDDDEDLNDSIGRIKRPTRAQLYLSELSLGRHKPLGGKRDVRLQRRANEEDDDDVQVVDDLANAGTPILEERAKELPWTRAKYLHFADNRRPPYYGTWRKRSQLISARRPLGQDKSHFDYEVDSDCEWEEEEPGESLSASEDEKERESEEESEEEYNEWFVPHGHLSDEELQNDGELEDGNTREAQKAKLQVLQQEFAQEMKKQTKKIKPRLLGPVWLDENGNKSQLCPAVFIQTIDMYSCWQLQPLTLEPPPDQMRDEEPLEDMKAKTTVMQLDEPLLQQLVRLIHGNSNAKTFLISEYLEYLKKQISLETQTLPPKTLLREKFDELASWKPVLLDNGEVKKSKKPKKRLCWIVNAEMLQKYQLSELTLQNQWSYTLTPKVSKADTSLHEPTPPPESTEASGTPKAHSEISRLIKRGDSTTSTPTTSMGSPSAVVSSTKKRGTLLMSVARDQQFHAATKTALISQYLRKQNDEPSVPEKKPSPATSPSNSEDVVLLSD